MYLAFIHIGRYDIKARRHLACVQNGITQLGDWRMETWQLALRARCHVSIRQSPSLCNAILNTCPCLLAIGSLPNQRKIIMQNYIYIYGCSSLANQTYLATHKPNIEPPYTRQVVHPLPQTRQGESVTKLKSLPLKGHGEGRIRGITRQKKSEWIIQTVGRNSRPIQLMK